MHRVGPVTALRELFCVQLRARLTVGDSVKYFDGNFNSNESSVGVEFPWCFRVVVWVVDACIVPECITTGYNVRGPLVTYLTV